MEYVPIGRVTEEEWRILTGESLFFIYYVSRTPGVA